MVPICPVLGQDIFQCHHTPPEDHMDSSNVFLAGYHSSDDRKDLYPTLRHNDRIQHPAFHLDRTFVENVRIP